MEDIVIVAAARTAVGKFGGTLAKTPATELGATVIKRTAGPLRPARRADRRGHPRPGAAGRHRAEPGAPIRHQVRPAAGGAGDDHQQGLRLGPEGGDAGRAGDPRRRQRNRHRRRPGKHEHEPARAARLARRPAHGRLEDDRLDDHRRPVGRLQPVPHGHHGRERGQEVRRDARAAGRAGAGLAAEGRGGAGRRPLQGRDRRRSASRRRRATRSSSPPTSSSTARPAPKAWRACARPSTRPAA